jgi:diphosphomevalonate decarboxylase
LHGGFVEWVGGEDDASSFARPLCPASHWDLRDLVVLVSRAPKDVASSDGHRIASAHPFMDARQKALPQRLAALKGALANRDWETLGEIVEHEALEVQGIMLSGQPAAIYFQPRTIELIHAIRAFRERDGLPVFFTLDAGPNVHVLCEGSRVDEVRDRLLRIAPDLPVLENRVGPGASLLDEHLL